MGNAAYHDPTLPHSTPCRTISSRAWIASNGSRSRMLLTGGWRGTCVAQLGDWDLG